MTDSINIYDEFISKFQYVNIHYLNRYIKIINFCISKNKNFKRKTHKFDEHHILPRSLFPKYKKEKSNLVNLLYREHFIVHLILTKMFDDKNYSMLFAFDLMNNIRNNKKSNNRLYQKEKELADLYRSKVSKEMWINLTEEQYREKCIRSKENAIKHYQNATKEEREYRNKRNSEGQQNLSILTCPHCGKQSKSRGNMKRFHFDNCLYNPNLTEDQKEKIINKRKEISIKNSQGQKDKTLYKCPLCEERLTIKNITKHFKKKHNINNNDELRILKREFKKLKNIQ